MLPDYAIPPFKLYDFEPSGNGWKVRTILRYLNLPFSIHWIDLLKNEQQADWFLAKNPVGQIPVLEDSVGTIWTESNAILEAFAAGTPLLPEGYAHHQIRAWLGFEQTWIDGIISRTRFRKLYPDAVPTEKVFFDAWAVEGIRALEILEKHLSDRDFMMGADFTIADISIYAYVHVAQEGGFDLDPLSNIRRWIRILSQRPELFSLGKNPEASQ